MGNQTSNVAESSRPERGHHHHHPGHQHAHGHSHGHPGVAPYQNVPNTHITHPGHTRTGPGQGHSRHPQGGPGGGGGGSVTGGGGHHHHHRPPGSERGSATGGGGHSPLDLNRAVHNQNANINMMQRSPSDTAMPMSIHDDKATTGVVGADGRSKATNNGATTVTVTEGMNIVDLSAAEDDVVPTVFRWEHGGREVYITGTFNEWTRQIPMHRSGNDFTYIHNLRRGKHAFKFIVDDEWRFAPDQPTVADIDGRINNFIDVTDFKPYTGDKSFEQEKNAAYYSKSHHQPPRDASSKSSGGGHGHAGGGGGGGYDHSAGASTVNAMSDDDPMTNDQSMDDPDGEVFTHNMPDMDEYTKDPPPLPPHLRHIILNKPPQLQDTAALPIPQHVALNHLYCTAIRDNMMVLGITQRFRTKFVTTVHYSPELSRT